MMGPDVDAEPLREMVESVAARYAVDRERVLLTGMVMLWIVPKSERLFEDSKPQMTNAPAVPSLRRPVAFALM